MQLHYTNYSTPQLQLQLHYTTLHPAVVVRWPLQPLQPLQKTQLQPPFGPSVDSLCHPWFTTTNLSYRLPIFETSATALCGTTTICHHISCWWCTLLWPIPAIPQRSIYLPGFTFQKSNITWHDITGHDMTPHNITYHDMTWHNISFM